jgi:serine/threonine-protein kinase
MAKVFLAKDLKHNRKVALKVLKPELAAVVGAERFLAEIETTANLQHPHILPLFDSGEADSFLFYVMPFVEGETLRERIDRDKQLPVDEALGIATAVAGALQTAHEQGVIHRDIKPGNILMSRGQPLVADFGIAIAVSAGGAGRLTETGLSLGTPYYMSPEQATGDQSIGPASDTFALACVLYELLTGEPPYPGNTAQAVLGKIIQGAPVSATAVRQSVPANVDSAIRKALEKLPADRFSGAHDFAKALSDPGFRHGELAGAAATGGRDRWKPLAMGLGTLALTFGVVAGWALLRSPEMPVSRYNIELPVTQFGSDFGANVTISPDGMHIVYVGDGDQGMQLWHRRRDQLRAVPIPGTDNAFDPVFSPDGERVAFERQGGEISVVSLSGEPPLTIFDGGRGQWGLAWGGDAYVYAYTDEGLIRVPEAGGDIEPFTVLDSARNETEHAWPQALPNGGGVLFTVVHGSATDMSQYDIAVADLETGEHEVLVRGVFARVTASGHLVYLTEEGTLLAASFDLDARQVGDPVALAEGVALRPFGSIHLALSEAGTLVYQTGSSGGGQSEFVWVTRSGQATPVHPGYTFTQGDVNYGWRLSPDETRVVFNSAVDGNEDVRIKHLPDGPEERITFSEDLDFRPFWTPDGQSVTYFSGPSDFSDVNLWSRRADGTGDRVLVLDDERLLAQGSWSPDGAWLVLRVGATEAMGVGGRDVLAFRPGVDSAATPLVASPDFIEGAPTVSPDGRWLAYDSNETGRREVFVRPFPDVNAGRLRVSTDGGSAPVWAKSGQELFFMDQAGALVAAQFDQVAGQVRARDPMFTIPAEYRTASEITSNDFYDVSSDGQRFLMARRYMDETEAESGPAFVLVQNFFDELPRLVPH